MGKKHERAEHVLAGDVGGTKTLLALFSVAGSGRLALVREATFSSRQHEGLEEVVRRFLEPGTDKVAAAGFGIAGPVLGDTVATTNLPWKVDLSSLASAIGCRRLRLMNDLETMAWGALHLPASDLAVLQEGVPRRGNRAVIAAGTGLGQALLFWDGSRHRPSATEGGHVDFAPRREIEVELLRFLRGLYPRVSYERILSGPGLVNILRFLHEGLGKPLAPAVRERMKVEDPGAAIGEAGITGACPTCTEAVEMFLGVYGAQAGNLALAILAVGGVYVGGGIVLKMLPRMTSSAFLEAFRDKGRYSSLMSEIPVQVLLDPRASLLGAAYAAAELVEWPTGNAEPEHFRQ